MDRTRVCDCQFKSTCQTFNDPLIEVEYKSASGHGCVRQTDYYRGKHCQAFRCAYLIGIVSDVFRHNPGEPGRPTSPNGGH